MLELIWRAALAASWVEQAATVLGLCAVWLATRQSLWNFPLGLVQVTLIGSVFYEHQLYADTFLQSVYFVALAYGWWRWMHPGAQREHLPVSRLSGLQSFALVALGLALTTGWSLLLEQVGDPMPWRDAFLATFGILGQCLQAYKKLETWIVWLAINIVAIGVYATLGLYWFVLLYGLYLLLALIGLRDWYTSYKVESRA